MATADKKTEQQTQIEQTTILLDIPARLQWDNWNGYCGEASLQCIGLYYGAWISQHTIRRLNKGEYLLQPINENDWRDPLETLKRLHFTYDEWDWKNAARPQFRDFCLWMKKSLIRQHPVFFGIFLPYMKYDDYDHIIPAVGLQFTNRDEYDPADVLISYDMYNEEATEKCLNEVDYGATRQTIDDKDDNEDGCLPLDENYGIAITGIIDEDHATYPCRLSIPNWDEPNPAFNEEPIEMNGTIKVMNLTSGHSYVLLRYASYDHVPTKGDAKAFLNSNFDVDHEFVATDSIYTYEDPKKIPSTGSVYYRCVKKSDD